MRRRKKHSEEFKRLAMSKLLTRGSRPIKSIGEELGINPGMIYEWVAKYGDKDPFMTGKPVSPQSLSAQEKLKLVFEFEALAEEQRGEFLRSRGVTEEQLAQWKNLMTESLDGTSSAENELRGQIRRLEKELARKEKALAEAAAILVLQKKIQNHYGSEDE